jgi:hypothetical protein
LIESSDPLNAFRVLTRIVLRKDIAHVQQKHGSPGWIAKVHSTDNASSLHFSGSLGTIAQDVETGKQELPNDQQPSGRRVCPTRISNIWGLITLNG